VSASASSAATLFNAGDAPMQSASTAAVADSSIGASIMGQQKGSTHDGVISSVDRDVNLAAGTGGGSQASDAVLEWNEPDWSALKQDSFDKRTRPFKILFVGVNSNEGLDLNLKEEYQNIKTAFDVASNSFEGPKPRLVHTPYSKWSDLMYQIRQECPTILHFGCHSEASGVELHGETVQPRQMIQAIQDHNNCARENGEAEIHVIILNACKSDEHAEKLLQCVDFSIGHAALVADTDAINFTYSLYSTIFKGMSLSLSFRIAKSVSSKGYRLYAQKDPRIFCMKHEISNARVVCEMSQNVSKQLSKQKRAQASADNSDDDLPPSMCSFSPTHTNTYTHTHPQTHAHAHKHAHSFSLTRTHAHTSMHVLVTQACISRVSHAGARTMPHSEVVSHIGTSHSYVTHMNESFMNGSNDLLMRDTPSVLLHACLPPLIYVCVYGRLMRTMMCMPHVMHTCRPRIFYMCMYHDTFM